MAAQEALGNAKTGIEQRRAVLARPVERAGAGGLGKAVAAGADLRLHAERAIVLLAQARQDNPELERAGCARPPWTWARAGSI